jgi:hypothetical protein
VDHRGIRSGVLHSDTGVRTYEVDTDAH